MLCPSIWHPCVLQRKSICFRRRDKLQPTRRVFPTRSVEPILHCRVRRRTILTAHFPPWECPFSISMGVTRCTSSMTLIRSLFGRRLILTFSISRSGFAFSSYLLSFMLQPIEEGARIDVSVSDLYDSTYAGNPHDLISQPLGYAFSRYRIRTDELMLNMREIIHGSIPHIRPLMFDELGREKNTMPYSSPVSC